MFNLFNNNSNNNQNLNNEVLGIVRAVPAIARDEE